MSRRRRQSQKKAKATLISVEANLTATRRRLALTPWLLIGALYVLSWSPWLSVDGPRQALQGAAALGSLWLLILRLIGRAHEVEWRLRRAHWVQLCMHSAVFVYWGAYDPLVREVAPLILAQLPVAYALDMLLSWTRGRAWSLGLGPAPIIGSLNLFLWFKAPHFHWQLGMVALAFLGRELLQWDRAGQRRHIFNPSAFALTIASIALIYSDSSVSHTWGEEIATHLEMAPYMFELIFALGLIVQLTFGVVWTTLSAALTLWGLDALWTARYGTWFFTDTAIPISVFLGMNLLITDPRTSPQNAVGKALFGSLYGLCVMPLYLGMLALGQPAFFDKLLQVPLCNLLAPRLERWGEELTGRLSRRFQRLPLLVSSASRRSAVGLWLGAFMLLRPALVDHPGRSVEGWSERCQAGERYACKGLWHSLEKGCGLGVGERCVELAIRFADPEALNRDLDRALLVLNESCKRGHEESCAMKTQLLSPLPSRSVAEPNEQGSSEQATGLVLAPSALSCEQGDGATCLEEARALIASGAPTAQIKARFERACALKEALGCVNLGLLHLQGRVEGASPKEARRYHEQACALGLAKACGRLAVLYARGVGGPVDLAEAQRATRRACEGGDDVSCLAVTE